MLIDILANGARGSRRRGPGACRGCGRKVFWVVSAAGHSIPCNEVPEVVALSGDVETVSTEHLHVLSCPEAARFKRPTTPAPEDTAPAPETPVEPGFEW